MSDTRIRVSVAQAEPLRVSLLQALEAFKASRTEATYWVVRDVMANLPPSNVYRWPKDLDQLWHNARAVCRTYENSLKSE